VSKPVQTGATRAFDEAISADSLDCHTLRLYYLLSSYRSTTRRVIRIHSRNLRCVSLTFQFTQSPRGIRLLLIAEDYYSYQKFHRPLMVSDPIQFPVVVVQYPSPH